ncbi:MAG: FKBP-type peptidyl-prolyl cis-trans isomerase [Gammaproteobacteria bacterium]
MSKPDLSSLEARASYGVGTQMGAQLKTIFEGVSLAAAVAGIEDAFNGADLQVSGDDLNEAFGEMQKRMEAAQAAQAGDKAKAGEAFLAENAKRDGVQTTDSGLQYEIVTAGTGEKPGAASTVRTHYAGTLIDGTEFDSSYKRGEPAEFPVNGVIAGWTEALQLMPAGSKWRLFIPYQLAYGAQGAGGAIGPFQALIFDIELLEIV